eukprot:1283612-Amphidinium_carterae.2
MANVSLYSLEFWESSWLQWDAEVNRFDELGKSVPTKFRVSVVLNGAPTQTAAQITECKNVRSLRRQLSRIVESASIKNIEGEIAAMENNNEDVPKRQSFARCHRSQISQLMKLQLSAAQTLRGVLTA